MNISLKKLTRSTWIAFGMLCSTILTYAANATEIVTDGTERQKSVSQASLSLVSADVIENYVMPYLTCHEIADFRATCKLTKKASDKVWQEMLDLKALADKGEFEKTATVDQVKFAISRQIPLLPISIDLSHAGNGTMGGFIGMFLEHLVKTSKLYDLPTYDIYYLTPKVFINTEAFPHYKEDGPADIFNLEIDGKQLKVLPRCVGLLKNLKTIKFRNRVISPLPSFIPKLKQAQIMLDGKRHAPNGSFVE